MLRCILLCLVVFVASSSAALYENTVTTFTTFGFMEKFCFHTNADFVGTYSFTNMLFPDPMKADPVNTYIALYDDEETSWPKVYQNNDLTCAQKLEISKTTPNLNVGQVMNRLAKGELVSQGVRNIMRNHFFFLAAVNCHNQQELSLQYTLHFLQPDGSEVSCDEQGILESNVVYLIGFVIISVINVLGNFKLLQHRAFHPVMQVFSISLITATFGCFFEMVHEAAYAGNGVGLPALGSLGVLLDYISQDLFIFMLLLLAQGWSITEQTLEYRMPSFISLGVLFILYTILFIWRLTGIDRATSTFVWATAPGILLLLIRCLMCAVFLWLLQRTLKKESASQKRMLYIMIAVWFTLWFLSLPFFTIFSNLMEPWVRMRVVTIVYNLIRFCAYAGFVVIMWPSRAVKYFEVSVPDVMTSGSPGFDNKGSYGTL